MSALQTVSSSLGDPSALRIYLAEARNELRRLARTPSFAAPSLAFPLVFYVLFGIVLPGSEGRATPLLVSYCVFGVMGPALFGFGVGLALERQQGWLELKRVSPMPTGAYFFAKIATSAVFASAVIASLSVTGVVFGGVELGALAWLRLVGTLLLGTLPFCALGLLIGAVVRGQAAVAVVNLVYLPMSVLSGLWMPLEIFPPIVQRFAVLWPAWHLSQLASSAIGLENDGRFLAHVGVLVAMTAVFLSLAATRLRTLGGGR